MTRHRGPEGDQRVTSSPFDDKAATWDDPAKVERAQEIAAAIGRAVALNPSMRLLEYGAGTGLVSQQMAGSVGPMTLADPSAGMRRVAQDKVDAGALPSTTRVWDLDLTTGAAPDERFELVVTVMTLHHIPDLSRVLKGFATLLAGGGHLCVVDLEEEDGSFHTDGDFGGDHGFDPKELAEQLGTAGFTVTHIERVHEVVRNGRAYPLFLAVCSPAA